MKREQAGCSRREAAALLVTRGIALAISVILQHDRTTWCWRHYQFVWLYRSGWPPRGAFADAVTYRLIFLHALILMLGGHYTYAQVRPGFWVQDVLDLSRNHYHRVGHLAQGFVPAIVARKSCCAFHRCGQVASFSSW